MVELCSSVEIQLDRPIIDKPQHGRKVACNNHNRVIRTSSKGIKYVQKSLNLKIDLTKKKKQFWFVSCCSLIPQPTRNSTCPPTRILISRETESRLHYYEQSMPLHIPLSVLRPKGSYVAFKLLSLWLLPTQIALEVNSILLCYHGRAHDH